MRLFFAVMIALAFLGCFHEGVETGVAPETEVAPAELPVVEYPCPNFDRGDWVLLVELPRRNLSPYQFRMVKEWIDPIVEAYVGGKDFLFVILKPGKELPDGRRTGGNIYQARYYLESPGLLHWNTTLQVFHFPDAKARWFQYWGNPLYQDRELAGFTVEFDSTPMFKPSVEGVEKSRDYLHFPEFGTSLDGIFVGGGGMEIRVDWVLRIYTR